MSAGFAVAVLAAVGLPYGAELALLGGTGDVFAQEKYRFCHEERYPLYPREREWCDLVGEQNHLCPDLPAACRAKVDPKGEAAWGGWGDGKGDSEGARAAPSDDDARKARAKESSWRMPEGMSGLSKILFFALVLIGAAFLVRAIVKSLSRDKVDDDDIPPEADLVPEEEASRVRAVETDVDRLLAQARAAAAMGDYARAMDAAYAALLRRLEGDGRIDMHESCTNGDYVRALRNDPDLARHVRDVVRDVERVHFGAADATGGLFQSLFARILPLVGRVAAVALMVLGAGMLSGCPGADDGGEVAAMSRGGTSPSGTRALFELLNKHLIHTSYRLAKLRDVDEGDADVVIMLPGGREDEDDWKALGDWVKDGGTLILAGVIPPKSLADVTWVPEQATDPQLVWPGKLGKWMSGLDVRVPVGEVVAVRGPSSSAEPLLTRDPWSAVGHYAVTFELGSGELVVFADHRLFTNIALTAADNAEALVRLFRARNKIEISDPWTGSGSDSPLEAVHRARLTPVVAQLLLLLLLFALYKGVAFGMLRDPPEHQRRSFADHVKALGTQYARAGASTHALRVYASWALERLRERVPRGRGMSVDELAHELALRSGGRPEDVARLLNQAQVASELSGPASFRPESLRGAHLDYRAGLDDAGRRALVMRELARLLGTASAPRAAS